MKNNNIKAVGFTVLGSILLVIGLVMVKTIQEPQEVIKVLSFSFVGIGCGVFGYNLGEIISNKVLQKYPDEAKRIEVELKDERNLIISCKAKAKAYDTMIYVYALLIFVFALMKFDLTVIVLLGLTYIFIVFIGTYFRYKYEKEM